MIKFNLNSSIKVSISRLTFCLLTCTYLNIFKIKLWNYFQTAGDGNMNKNSSGAVGIGCNNNNSNNNNNISNNNNINRSPGLSNIQRPIIQCLNEKLPILQQDQQQQNRNYNVNHLMHPQNQQNQVTSRIFRHFFICCSLRQFQMINYIHYLFRHNNSIVIVVMVAVQIRRHSIHILKSNDANEI